MRRKSSKPPSLVTLDSVALNTPNCRMQERTNWLALVVECCWPGPGHEALPGSKAAKSHWALVQGSTSPNAGAWRLTGRECRSGPSPTMRAAPVRRPRSRCERPLHVPCTSPNALTAGQGAGAGCQGEKYGAACRESRIPRIPRVPRVPRKLVGRLRAGNREGGGGCKEGTRPPRWCQERTRCDARRPQPRAVLSIESERRGFWRTWCSRLEASKPRKPAGAIRAVIKLDARCHHVVHLRALGCSSLVAAISRSSSSSSSPHLASARPWARGALRLLGALQCSPAPHAAERLHGCCPLCGATRRARLRLVLHNSLRSEALVPRRLVLRMLHRACTMQHCAASARDSCCRVGSTRVGWSARRLVDSCCIARDASARLAGSLTRGVGGAVQDGGNPYASGWAKIQGTDLGQAPPPSRHAHTISPQTHSAGTALGQAPTVPRKIGRARCRAR